MDLSGEIDRSELSLIAAARQGDEMAWARLVEAHQEPVFRLAYLILGDPADAEDVAQETFVRTTMKLSQFDTDRPLRPWLMGIAANLARNRKRSLGRYWAALRRYGQDRTRPQHPLETRSEATALWQAVRRLRPKAQEIIYLRYFLEMSETETAAALEIAPGTAKSRLHRALKQLRRVVEEEFPELRLLEAVET